MEIHPASADDPRRVWQPGEEPAASAARPQDDAGGSRGAQRRSRHRGQPHRERQARSPSLNCGAVGRGSWPHRKRPAPLSIRPASSPLSAVGGRPFSPPYFAFSVCRSGTTVATGAIFISFSPPPARQPPAVGRGGRGQGKEILNAKRLVNAQHIRHPLQRLCSGTSEQHQQA
jgi:hypothetical protein